MRGLRRANAPLVALLEFHRHQLDIPEPTLEMTGLLPFELLAVPAE
jgi:hypothetical protein